MRNGTLWCIAVIAIAGNIIGLGIGYVPVVIQSYLDSTNCTRIADSEFDCVWSDDAICHWNGTLCQFRALVVNNASCLTLANREHCEALEESCIWTMPRGSREDRCRFQQGWDKTQTALVGTLSTIGGIVGSILVHFSITRAGLNNTIVLCGIVSTLAGALCIVGWHSNDDAARLAFLLTGRFCTGVALGMASAAVPMYVGDVATREVAGVLGVSFQCCITFGIMTAAMIGYIADPSLDSMHPREGVIALNYYYLVLSVILIPVGFFADKPLFDEAMRSSLLTFRHSAFLRIQPGGQNDYGNAAAEDASLYRRPLYIGAAFLIAAGQQFSLINGIMSYATTMSADIGIGNPYLFTFLLFAWNFVCTIAGIWLAYRMTAGNMFLWGQLGCALSCFVIAVPVMFFNDNESAPQTVIIIGMFLFILIFEMSMGPTFYVIAQSMFPAELRSAGCALTIFFQFVCNGIVTFLYPNLVTEFAGGPSKPQDKGVGAVFFLFAGVGLVLTCLLKMIMNKIREDQGGSSAMNDLHQGDGGHAESGEPNLTQY